MKSELLKRYQVAAEQAAAATESAPQPLDYDAWIDVESSDGTRYGMRYQQLLWTRVRGNRALHLHFATHTVTIQGLSLDQLYVDLLHRRVARLVAASERIAVAEPGALLITAVIVMQKPTPGAEETAVPGIEPDDNAS